MPTIKSSEAFIRQLECAARHRMSPEEQRKQIISFILSSAGDDTALTRERIEEVLDRRV